MRYVLAAVLVTLTTPAGAGVFARLKARVQPTVPAAVQPAAVSPCRCRANCGCTSGPPYHLGNGYYCCPGQLGQGGCPCPPAVPAAPMYVLPPAHSVPAVPGGPAPVYAAPTCPGGRCPASR